MGVNAAAFVQLFCARRREERSGTSCLARSGFPNLRLHLVEAEHCRQKFWARLDGLGLLYGAWKTSGFRKAMSFDAPAE